MRLSLHWVFIFLSYVFVSLTWFPSEQYDIGGAKTVIDESSYRWRKKQRPLNQHSHLVGQSSYPQLKNPQWTGDLMRGDDFVSVVLSGEKDKHPATVSYFLFADRITYFVNEGKYYELFRKLPMERLYLRALYHLQRTTNGWPALRMALRGNGFLPFIMDYQDVAGCNGNILKLQNNRRLGLFTLSMPSDPDCPVRLTMPNYFTLDALGSVDYFLNYKRYAPAWPNKLDKAVWRGTLNHGRHRWKLAKLNVRYPSLLDAGITGVQRDLITRTNLTEVGGLATKMRMTRYSHYKAILDVDGNSWSGRFGHLMCMDAVVIKVAPRDVDYFWSDLEPYQHYVPVNETMDNLLDQVRWVISQPNRSQEIIERANAWCREKLRMDVLVGDLLDIWDDYASMVVPPTPNDDIHYKLPKLKYWWFF